MNRKPNWTFILYVLCLYDIYLYLPDVLSVFKIDFYPRDFDLTLYFDAAMLLIGGIVIGIVLLKTGGRFDRYLGVLMILMNVVLTPWFLFKAMP
ncbi:hypothetical protein A0256_10955 [Mucilaginibacter sp. PAMC 26640]|nr:hypothetical protein A0256_10955 [Mucilaginibacter sp. PAMC 26640]